MLVAVQSELGVNNNTARCVYLEVLTVVAFSHLVERGYRATNELQESGSDGANIGSKHDT